MTDWGWTVTLAILSPTTTSTASSTLSEVLTMATVVVPSWFFIAAVTMVPKFVLSELTHWGISPSSMCENLERWSIA